jgi:hypothetical protein
VCFYSDMLRDRLTALIITTCMVLALSPQPARAAGLRYGGLISRAVVMYRAHDWLRQGVAYSQDNRLARWDLPRGRRYRPDCSGFVSMSWALETRAPAPGRALVTWELPSVSATIRWSSLREGDILLRLVPANRAAEHVMLFERWLDAAHTRAAILEESSRTRGMLRLLIRVPTVARAGYRPYRYRQIR